MRYRVHPQNTTGRVQHLMAREGREGLNRFLSLAQDGSLPQPDRPACRATGPATGRGSAARSGPTSAIRPIIENVDPGRRCLAKRSPETRT